MAWFSYAMVWAATAAAVSVAIVVTGSMWPLLAFVFPASVSIHT